MTIETLKDVIELIQYTDNHRGQDISSLPHYKLKTIENYDVYLIYSDISWNMQEVITEKDNTIILDKESLQGLKLCSFCGELYEKSEVKRAEVFGWLCSDCIKAFDSRGESLKIITNYVGE